MTVRFDRLEADLIALRAQLSAELEQYSNPNAAIGNNLERQVAGPQSPVRPVVMGTVSSGPTTKTWVRLLKSIRFGAGRLMFLPRLGPQLRFALDKPNMGSAIRRLDEPIARTWSYLLSPAGFGSGSSAFFSFHSQRTRPSPSRHTRGKQTGPIRDEPDYLSSERQALARPVRVRGLFSSERLAETWSRLLRPISSGNRTTSRFAHLGSRMRFASLFSGERIAGAWSRLLKPAEFAQGDAETFSHRGPRMALGRKSKAPSIVIGIVLAAFIPLALGAAAIAQFNRISLEMTGVKRDLAATRERLVKLEANAASALLADKMKLRADDRMRESAVAVPTPPFALTRDEIQLIRDFIKVPPPLPGAPQNINAGDRIPDTALTSLPEPIMEKVPKLRGARFTVDRNSAIIVVAPGTNRADVIINPT